MKNWKIGTKVSFSIEGCRYIGRVSDIYELGINDYIYDVTTDLGTFQLNNEGKAIV